MKAACLTLLTLSLILLTISVNQSSKLFLTISVFGVLLSLVLFIDLFYFKNKTQ